MTKPPKKGKKHKKIMPEFDKNPELVQINNFDKDYMLYDPVEHPPAVFAYPRYKYLKNYSPVCIVTPSVQNMMVIMRSCLGVNDLTNLYY